MNSGYVYMGIVGMIIILLLGLIACSNIHYVSNDSLTGQTLERAGFDVQKKIAPDGGVESYSLPKSFGAIYVEAAKKGEEGRIFLLRRHNSLYVAETPIFEEMKNKNFDRAYLAIGADKNSKAVGIKLRFEY